MSREDWFDLSFLIVLIMDALLFVVLVATCTGRVP